MVFIRQRSLTQKVRTVFERADKRLLPFPLLLAGEVPVEQDLRHPPFAEHRRFGPLGVFEQAFDGEGIVLGRVRVAQGARRQPADGVHQHQRGQLAAGEHKVADRDDARGEVLPNAFVKRLIASADQREMRETSQLARHFLVEAFALRAEQNHRAGGRRAEHALDGGKDRFGLHHHPPAPAVGCIIGGVVLVGSPVADVVRAHLDQPVLNRAFQDADIEIRLKYLRKEAEHVKSHS